VVALFEGERFTYTIRGEKQRAYKKGQGKPLPLRFFRVVGRTIMGAGPSYAWLAAPLRGDGVGVGEGGDAIDGAQVIGGQDGGGGAFGGDGSRVKQDKAITAETHSFR